MEHADAIAAHAADRYLLGDLTAAEADAFEEHYFDCSLCADELRIGTQFVDGARRLGRQKSEPSVTNVVPITEARRKRWIPAAVAALLVLAIGTPLLLRSRSTSGPAFEVASQHSFLLGESRSAGEVPALDGNAPIVLWADVPPEPAYSRYEARLLRPDGPALTLPFAPDPGGEATPLTVRGLHAGAHTLVIAGIGPAGQPVEIARHRFIVRR